MTNRIATMLTASNRRTASAKLESGCPKVHSSRGALQVERRIHSENLVWNFLETRGLPLHLIHPLPLRERHRAL